MSFKKLKIINSVLVMFATFIFSTLVVNAECTYVEKARLNEIASSVKTNYEVVDEVRKEEGIDPDSGEVVTYERTTTTFKISIYNVTDDLYIIHNNNLNNEESTIPIDEVKDGTYTFISDDIENIIKYTFNIYANTDTCSGEILKTYNFTKPKMNLYSQYGICHGLQDLPYCKTYITEELDMTEAELTERVQEYLNSNRS